MALTEITVLFGQLEGGKKGKRVLVRTGWAEACERDLWWLAERWTVGESWLAGHVSGAEGQNPISIKPRPKSAKQTHTHTQICLCFFITQFSPQKHSQSDLMFKHSHKQRKQDKAEKSLTASDLWISSTWHTLNVQHTRFRDTGWKQQQRRIMGHNQVCLL